MKNKFQFHDIITNLIPLWGNSLWEKPWGGGCLLFGSERKSEGMKKVSLYKFTHTPLLVINKKQKNKKSPILLKKKSSPLPSQKKNNKNKTTITPSI